MDRGKYFVINRGRQYGKTTTLYALVKYLRQKAEYLVLFMDFQEIGTAEYRDEDTFARTFAEIFLKALRNAGIKNEDGMTGVLTGFGKTTGNVTLRELFGRISVLCSVSSWPVVMIIDEVGSAANNQVFLDFLAQLRRYYLNRQDQAIFHSVILAGVYDVKNLKLKLRAEADHQYNSPWNIAADFDIDMSFTSEQIAGMLQEYEADRHTGMRIEEVSGEIYRYTSGYPYLVSVICKFLDEKIPGSKGFGHETCVWTKQGIAEAVKLLLKKNTPLFDSMAKQLDSFQELRQMVEDILYQGKQISYSPMDKSVSLGVMFGFLKEEEGHVAVANRIFEMALLDMFMTEEAVRSEAFRYGQRDKNQFVRNGRLDMELVLEKFVTHFTDIYNGNDDKFVEEYGRKFFLLYLKPIINGVGNYYLEAQTRDARRTDVIVDYLDYYHLNKGYLLSFNFNQNKETGIKTVKVGEKVIVEATV